MAWVKGCNPPSDTTSNPRCDRELRPAVLVVVQDLELRRLTLVHGRQIVTGMIGCRVPIVAAVNGPAVGLGCSLVALSDIAFMAESAHLADPHVLLGLVAADGGPITWPLMTSLMLAKEYALTGERIPAEQAAQIGLVNHVLPDDEVLDAALACARRIATLPREGPRPTHSFKLGKLAEGR